MKIKEYLSSLLAVVMIISAMPTLTFATEPDTVNAEIMTVYGGADGIISMTFDDGDYASALVLDELFEKYDLKGSLMLIAEKASKGSGSTVSATTGKKLFESGRLEPQSHSMTHTSLKDGEVPADQRDELYKTEIADSKDTLQSIFPDNDILTFAIPYGRMEDAAFDYAAEHYYAIRTTTPGVQTLNPGFSRENGSWSMMYSPATYSDSFDTEEAQWERIKTAIDNASNGWYIPITHRVGNGENVDLTYEMADRMFAYIASLRDDGKVWVTTYSEAVKYVRERQNSSVRAYLEDGSIYVDVTMADVTEDGLPLASDVFNTPLTVKVEVPAEYGDIYYTTAEKEYLAQPFSDGSKNYVYVNVAPNAGPVKLRVSSEHHFGDWGTYDDDMHKRTCTECGYADYSDHVWNEGEITKAPTHLKTGSKKCTCIYCGEVATFSVKKTTEHTFSEELELMQFKASDATCTSGERYYYVCSCGAVGTETFEVGVPLGHTYGEWIVEEEATATTNGRMIRECECGEILSKDIPATGESDGIPMPALIGIIAGGAALLIAASVFAIVIIKKKKKA